MALLRIGYLIARLMVRIWSARRRRAMGMDVSEK